jgi:NitT/TauT family transport system substrate-binding protein
MDMGMASVSTSFYNGLARGLGVRLVAEAARGTPEFSSSGLVIRRDLIEKGRVRDFADLRGLTVALAGPGGLTTLYLGKALERGGLTKDDINLVTISYPDMHAAFVNGAIDAAIQTEPLASVGQRQGITTKWRTSGQLTGELPSLVLMYGPTMLGDRRPAGERFMVAYGRGVRDYYDAFITGRADRAAAVEIVTRHSSVTDPALYDIMDFATINPDLRVDVAGITAEQEWFWNQGLLPELRAPVDVAAATDNSFVDYALRVLGPYQP